MKNAVILARASSGKQVIEGDTIDHQINQCEEYVTSKGWKAVKRFPPVESGTAKEREYFQEVIDYCTNPRK